MTDKNVTEKAEEQVVIKRGKLWMLYLAAVGGAFSIVSHGADGIEKLVGLL